MPVKPLKSQARVLEHVLRTRKEASWGTAALDGWAGPFQQKCIGKVYVSGRRHAGTCSNRAVTTKTACAIAS